MRYYAVHRTSRIRCQSTAAKSTPRTGLTAVRRSLAGLPLHRSEGTPVFTRNRHIPSYLVQLAGEQAKQQERYLSAGGLLIAPVLQPQGDNIPFGLALTLHSQAQQDQQAVLPREDNLYELQYILEGKGQVSFMKA